MGRKRSQNRLIELLEQRQTRPLHLLEGRRVELFQAGVDGEVDGPEAEKVLVAEVGHDPSFGV